MGVGDEEISGPLGADDDAGQVKAESDKREEIYQGLEADEAAGHFTLMPPETDGVPEVGQPWEIGTEEISDAGETGENEDEADADRDKEAADLTAAHGGNDAGDGDGGGTNEETAQVAAEDHGPIRFSKMINRVDDGQGAEQSGREHDTRGEEFSDNGFPSRDRHGEQ